MIECKITGIKNDGDSAEIQLEGDTTIYDTERLENFRRKLENGLPFTEHQQLLPVGISQKAETEDRTIKFTIKVPKSINLNNQSYLSTNDLISMIEAGVIKKVSIKPNYIQIGSD